VDVVRLVVENGEFLDLANDLTKVGLAVGSLAGGLLAERVGEEVVAQIVILQRRVANLAEEDAMDVGEKEIAGLADEADVVLNVERELEIVTPVATRVAVGRQDGVVEENTEPIESARRRSRTMMLGAMTKKITRKRGVGLVEAVKETPRDEEREDLGLAGAGREFKHVAGPILGEHAARHGAGGIEADQVVFIASTADLVEPDDGFNGFPLREVVAERRERVIGVLDQVLRLEPVAEQRDRRGGRAGITLAPTRGTSSRTLRRRQGVSPGASATSVALLRTGSRRST